MKSTLSTSAVVLGVILVAASLVWGILFPVGAGWTEEKSIRLRELRGRAHVLGAEVAAAKAKPSMHAGDDAGKKEAEYEQVVAELKQLGEEAEGKIEAPKTAASILRYAGIAFVIAGGFAILASRG